MRSLITGLALALLVAACASDPLVRWGQGQQLYNAAMTEIIRYREPCVVGPKWPDGGPGHALCFIDNETMIRMMVSENAAAWSQSANMDIESVRSTVLAYARGEIKLPAPDPKTSKDKIRYAPHFDIEEAFRDIKASNGINVSFDLFGVEIPG